jgi:hypothetical protein
MTLSYETQTMQVSSSNLQVKETILAIHASSLLWQMSTWMQQSEGDGGLLQYKSQLFQYRVKSDA